MASAGAATAVSKRGFTALRVHTFRLYIVGSAFSRVGDNMESVARSWLVWQLTQSEFWLGMMVLCHWLPTTVLSIYAGVLADRVDNRKLIMYCEGLYLISAVSIGTLTLLGLINIWHVVVLLLIHGLSGAISNPSRQVLVHNMVGKENLMSAVSLTNSLFQCMAFVGPAIAGVLIAAVGVGSAYMIGASTFVPAIVVMSIIRVAATHQAPSRASTLRSSAEGLKYMRDNRLLLGLLGMASFPALLIGDAISAMMPVFATKVLHVGPDGMGFLLSGYGFGAILAALFISYVGGLRRKGPLVIVAGVLYGVFLVAFSQSSSYFLSMALLVAVGMSAVTSHTVINVLLQLNASDNLRGRVMGLHSMGTLGVRTFNGPLIGSFAAAIGAPFALGIMGGLVALSVIAIATRTPESWKLD